MLIPEVDKSSIKSPKEIVQGIRLMFNTDIPVIARDYLLKLAFIPDLHTLIKEPRNRNNIYVPRLEQILDELCYVLYVNKINGVMFLGDLADAGASMSSFEDEVRRLTKIINIIKCCEGNGFTLLGNHERTYSKNNPFYAITSLDCEAVQKETFGLSRPGLLYPYLRTPALLDYGVVRVYFMHYRKDKKDKAYKVTDFEDGNIALYHDDLITFESKMELYHHKLGQGINVLSTDIFQNVNWAIMGHIHTPLQTFTLNNYRGTVVDCPGSLLGRTVAEKHEKVNIPVLCLTQTSWHREYLPFNIGKFEETVNEQLVAEERNKRALTKLLKKEVATSFAVVDYQDMLANIPNSDVRETISKAQDPIEPKSLDLYRNWSDKRDGIVKEPDDSETVEDGEIVI